MSLWTRIVRLVAREHPAVAAAAKAADRERGQAVEQRERKVAAHLEDARAAQQTARTQTDRMGRLLIQARHEAVMLGGPPVVQAGTRRRRAHRPMDLCAASS